MKAGCGTVATVEVWCGAVATMKADCGTVATVEVWCGAVATTKFLEEKAKIMMAHS